ncbi:hypothetical protein BGZ88_001106 [Linnemannia elongata]|nr:hypothetical protein BGZ88_001106 [Linnemannia elongata]
MTQQKRQSTTSKRTASPHVDSPSAAGAKEEPPKKRGRTTRRSLAVQAEEDAIAAAKDRHEEQEEQEEDGDDGDAGEKEEEEEESLMDGKGEKVVGGDSEEKSKKVEEEKDEDGTQAKVKEEEPQDNDKTAVNEPQDDDTKTARVKKEEDTEDKKQILEIPQHMVVEKGHVYFFYRPKIDVDQPSGPDDVQKLYMLLSPDDAVGRVSTSADSKYDGSTSSVKESKDDVGSGDGGKMVKKEDESGGALHRLLIVPRKALPVYEPNTSGGNKPGSRNWAFVDTASSNLATVESRLQEYTYTTKTRGDRTQAAARFIAQARYEFILDHVDPEHPQRQSSHFVYQLEVPTTPGPVQEAFKIAKEGQFLVHVKNPSIQTPATARGAVRYATLKDKAAKLPKHLQEKFKGVRKDEVRYAPMDSSEFLDMVHVELVLLAVKRGAREELEELLKELEEEVEEEMARWSESESEGEGGVERVYKELEMDEKTIPAAVDEFK